MGIADDGHVLFLALLSINALFIPAGAPNVISTVYDITLPEVRSTALAAQYFIESASAALAPLAAGWIADRSSLPSTILGICVFTWVLCAGLLGLAPCYVPRDVELLRTQMRERAKREQTIQAVTN